MQAAVNLMLSRNLLCKLLILSEYLKNGIKKWQHGMWYCTLGISVCVTLRQEDLLCQASLNLIIRSSVPPTKSQASTPEAEPMKCISQKKKTKQIVQNSGIFFCRCWRLNPGPDTWLRIGFPLVCTPAPCSGIA